MDGQTKVKTLCPPVSLHSLGGHNKDQHCPMDSRVWEWLYVNISVLSCLSGVRCADGSWCSN